MKINDTYGTELEYIFEPKNKVENANREKNI